MSAVAWLAVAAIGLAGVVLVVGLFLGLALWIGLSLDTFTGDHE